jgi:hypothetical protein
MAKGVAILVGTRKGAYLFRSSASRKRWKAEGPYFSGEPVYHVAFDPRDRSSLFAALNPGWGGPRIEVSRDLGRTWKAAKNPAFDDPALTFQRTWHIEAGHASQPKVVWAGTEPAALFRSDDGGMTWTHMPGLRAHAAEHKWGPGAGGEGLHSIALDPNDPKRMSIGISVAGVYDTRDGGRTWSIANRGTRTPLPVDKDVESQRCVHHLVSHPAVSGVRFQQNHVGTYWGQDGGWREITAGLPGDFGFAAAIHPHDPETAFVFPLAPRDRLAPEPGAAVWRTRDAGKSWKRLAGGLPRGARLEVLREGLATDRLDPAGVYFGATSGYLWASRDEGKSWSLVAEYLPGILSVSTATLG